MSKMEILKREAREAGKAADFHEMGTVLTSKLALLEHALIHGSDQLGEWSIAGLADLVGEIEDNVSIALEFCQKSEEYFHYLNNPKALAKEKELEEVVA